MTETSSKHRLNVTVNGKTYDQPVEGRLLLSDYLRHEIGLTGTHVGCEHGVCGACTVIVDGEPTRSCLMLAIQADGASIETVESLAPVDGDLSPLQVAFRKHHALQCGFCTPGFLMSATAFIKEQTGRHPSRQEIAEGMSGNICRCTGYTGIIAAVSEILNGPAPEKEHKDAHHA